MRYLYNTLSFAYLWIHSLKKEKQMITLNKQFILKLNNIYEGNEIFSLNDIKRIESKYAKTLESNYGLLNNAQLETIRLFYIRKFEILQALRINNFEEAIEQFNELCEFFSDYQVWANTKETFDFLRTTNNEEEVQEMIACETYDKTKKWFVMDYGAYANSKNEEELKEFIKEFIEMFENRILG
jgi:hypothetical protein